MVAKRIVVAESSRCVGEGLGTLEAAVPQCIEVIDKVVSEQLVQAVKSTRVHQMTVQCDQLVDSEPLLGG